MLRFWG